jgi:4-amino-4-deoxy-L-arabinose transferase-like glycosyltransferase
MMIRAWLKEERHQFLLLLVAALLARAAYFISHTPHDFLSPGGDSLWYVQQGWLIFHNALPATLSNVGPLYPLLLAAAWAVNPGAPYPADPNAVPPALLVVVCLAQVLLSMLMIGLVYLLAYLLTGKHRPSMIAAVGIGLGPAFVMEPFLVLTETVFMALLVLAVWLYEKALRNPSIRQFGLVGVVFALAAMVRPILLLFPLFLIPHMWASFRPRLRSAWVGALLGGFLLMLLPWRIYVTQGTGQLIPEGFFSNLWIGSTGNGKFIGAQATDKLRQGFEGGPNNYAQEAEKVITEDPAHWVLLRVRKTAEAILQPHGTDYLPHFQTKQSFAGWWQSDRSVTGLWAIINVPGFWGKLAIYIFHYTALVFGVIGAWLSLRHWRNFYTPFAIIIYFIGTYGVLTILPRYLFPTQVFFWILAGVGIAAVWERATRRQTKGAGVVPAPIKESI